MARNISVDGISGACWNAATQQDHRLLDMKVTARNLEFARELADKAVRSIDPHVFKVASKQSSTRLERKERKFHQSRHE